MSARVVIRPAADRDIDEHYSYIAAEREEAADRFLEALADALQRLSDLPGIGRERLTDSLRLAGIREWPLKGFEKHIIFYRFVDDRIDVLRILHAARDIDAVLLESI